MDADQLALVAAALPDYELGRELGRGHSGVVLTARHRKLGRDVAVKQYSEGAGDDLQAARFRREAQTLAQLAHPHVVTVYDYREAGPVRLLVMELLDGGTFADTLRGAKSLETAVAGTMAAASGLHHVHEQGVLHRDVKPENLMLTADGVLKVTDFGVARRGEADRTVVELTHAGRFLGTPAYVAPEQIAEAMATGWPPVGAAADQYGLAAVLYFALSGRFTHDVDGGLLALFHRRMHDDPTPLGDVAPEVPARVADVVMRGLARDPAARHPSVEAFAIALGEAATVTLGAGWSDRSTIEIRALGPIQEASRAIRPPARPADGDTGQATSVAMVDARAVPVPSRVRSGESAAFVGRVAELDALASARKRAESGSCQMVLLSGEPGVGKTSLACTFARQVAGDDGVVLYGRCDEDLGIPYQPWAEVLSHLVRYGAVDVLQAHARARKAELCVLVPGLTERVPVEPSASADGEAERYLLFGAVVDLLERFSATAPIVVILDDLHWADRPTVQLLRHLVGADAALRVTVVGTFRDSELGADHPLTEALAELHRESGVERIAVAGLDDVELLEMIEAIAGHPLDADGPALRDALVEETAGNPFFVGEILRHLVETGQIVEDEQGRWSATRELRSSSLPVSVREVVTRRIARLGDETRQVLSTASVIGRDFDLALLVRVVDLDEDRVVDALERALGAAVITEGGSPGSFTFAHALIAHTLYGEQSALRRARTHRAIGEALEELCGSRPSGRVGELAYHWAHAIAPQDLTRAIDYARMAGDNALAHRAPDEAVRWYREAIGHLDHHLEDDPHRRAALLLALGEAQRQVGDAGHRETLLAAAELAAQCGDDDLLTQAAIANNRGWNSRIGVVDEERVHVLRRALDAVGDVDTTEHARLLATLCGELLFGADFDLRLELAERAITVARATGDPKTLLDTLIRTHESTVGPPTLARRIAWTTEACSIADQLDDPVLRIMAYIYRHLAALEAGDLAWVRRGLEVATTEVDHLGQPTYQWVAEAVRSMERAVAGDVADAERVALRALQLGMESGQPDAMGAFGLQLATLRWMQGRLGEMVPLLEQSLLDVPGVIAVLAGLALSYTECGRSDEARRLLDEQAAIGFEQTMGSGWLPAHSMWSLVACRLGDRRAARILLDQLRPWRDQFISSHFTAYGPVAHPAGALAAVLGHHDEADELFALSLQLNGRMEAPFFTAFTSVAWAELLAERSGTEARQRARRLADEAAAIASRGGYAGVERDARSLLDRLA